MKKKIISLVLSAAIAVLTLSGCTSKTPNIPFTDDSIGWKSTENDVFALEGKDYETYSSIYGGPTYTFPKTYLDQDGTIKYMFDDKNKLVSVSWTYTADTPEEINDMYARLQEPLLAEYGESGFNQGAASSAGDVWYLEDGNIILYTMLTSELNALQYSYLSPDVSTKESEKVNQNDDALKKLQQLTQ